MTFDLKKARACAAFVEPKEAFLEALAEIERLQASLIDLHAEYINTLEKNPECSAWDLDEQSDADQRRLRKNAAHAISIEEPLIYLQADQRAVHVQELEDALVEATAWKLMEEHNEFSSIGGPKVKDLVDFLDDARQQLRAEGKIGPDVMPRSWQITDERTTALDRVLNYMDYMYPKSSPYYHCTLDVSVLRAMLEGAGQ